MGVCHFLTLMSPNRRNSGSASARRHNGQFRLDFAGIGVEPCRMLPRAWCLRGAAKAMTPTLSRNGWLAFVLGSRARQPKRTVGG